MGRLVFLYLGAGFAYFWYTCPMCLGEEGAYVVWHPMSSLSPLGGKSGRPAPSWGTKGHVALLPAEERKQHSPERFVFVAFQRNPQYVSPTPPEFMASLLSPFLCPLCPGAGVKIILS